MAESLPLPTRARNSRQRISNLFDFTKVYNVWNGFEISLNVAKMN